MTTKMRVQFADLNPDVFGFELRVAENIARSNALQASDDGKMRKQLGGLRACIQAHRANVRDTMAEYGIAQDSAAWRHGLRVYAALTATAASRALVIKRG